MPLLTPTTRTVSQSPGKCFFAEYAGTTILRQGQGNISTSNSLICADNQSDLDTEISLLGLSVPETKGQQAATLFKTFDSALQIKFGALFQAISNLTSDALKVTFIQATPTGTDEEAAAKAQLLDIFAAP